MGNTTTNVTRRRGKHALSCHVCGGALVRDTRPQEYTYKGETITVDQPGWYCDTCDEGVLTPEDQTATEAALRDFKAKVDGVLTATEVRAARAKLKLSQRQAGEILGGGVRAFQKYEKGTATVSQPMSNLLRVLAQNPDLVKTLPNAAKVIDRKRGRPAVTAKKRAQQAAKKRA